MLPALSDLLPSDYARDAFPYGFISAPTEDRLALGAPIRNQPAIVHGDKCIKCRLHDPPIALLTPFERQTLPVKVPINRRGYKDQSQHQDSDQRDAGDAQVGNTDRVSESRQWERSGHETRCRHTNVVHYRDS